MSPVKKPKQASETSKGTRQTAESNKLRNAIIVVAVGVVLWFMPVPSGLTASAWRLFAVFAATVLGLILQPLPLGATAFIALTFCASTKLLTPQQALSGFGSTTIWLIVSAFLFTREAAQDRPWEKSGVFDHEVDWRQHPQARLCARPERSGDVALHAFRYRPNRRGSLPRLLAGCAADSFPSRGHQRGRWAPTSCRRSINATTWCAPCFLLRWPPIRSSHRSP